LVTTTNWASWAEYRNAEILTLGLPAGGDIPCAIFFPADYSIGMANLGFHYIYRSLREMGVLAERFFASPIPYRSVERDTLLERFSVVLGSVSYEADVLTFAKWLHEGGIVPSRTLREMNGSPGAPLVGAGGAVTYINPLCMAGICDFIVLGDGTETAGYMVEILRHGLSREKTLGNLAEHPSIFVPSIHGYGRHSLRAAKRDVSRDFGRGTWTTPRTVFGNTLLIELQRGCAKGCRFCALPSCFAPMRQRELDLVKDDIEVSERMSDFSRIGLVTPEAGDYKALDELLEFAELHDKGVSFASLRVDGITEKMMRAVVRGGRHSVTIAPESGDEALREKCGKKFTDRLVVDTLKMARETGAKSAKLYFMAGLPGETDEQVVSISKLCMLARDETGLRITAAVSPFVPKPGTAWAEEEFAGEKKLKSKYSLLKKSFGGIPGVKLQEASIKEACGEYAVSWATSVTSKVMAEAPLSGASYRKLEGMVNKKEVYAEFDRLGFGHR
jgi:radical SAM superfamily enzyme YgiQ (UPF0313 family)